MSEVQERPIDKVCAALAKAQGEFKELTKGRTAEVPTKTGGKYSYSYADLHDVMESVREGLKLNELAVTQTVIRAGNEQLLRSSLVHSSGQRIDCDIPLIAATQGSGPQAFGSALTYARRYGICTLLGVVADEDDDGQAAANAPKPPAPRSTPPKLGDLGGMPSPAQVKRLFAIATSSGWSKEEMKDLIKRVTSKESSKDLTKKELDGIVEHVQAHPKS